MSKVSTKCFLILKKCSYLTKRRQFLPNLKNQNKSSFLKAYSRTNAALMYNRHPHELRMFVEGWFSTFLYLMWHRSFCQIPWGPHHKQNKMFIFPRKYICMFANIVKFQNIVFNVLVKSFNDLTWVPFKIGYRNFPQLGPLQDVNAKYRILQLTWPLLGILEIKSPYLRRTLWFGKTHVRI